MAEQVAVIAPDVARAALGFARHRLDDLRADYVGSTGAPYSRTGPMPAPGPPWPGWR